MFLRRKVGPERRATLPSQKDDLARGVTLLAEPMLCDFFMNTFCQVL